MKRRQLSLFHSLLLLLDSRWDIRIGVSGFDTEREKHVIIACHRRKGSMRLLRFGDKLNRDCLTFLQPSIYTDCGPIPLLYVNEKLHGEDPETWVDREEKKLIPWGMTSDQVTTEWDSVDDRVFAASIRTQELRKFVDKAQKRNVYLASLGVPFMDVAGLYAKPGKTTFLIWEIGETSSIAGYVEQGELKQITLHWAGLKDLETQPESVLESTVSLLQRISNNRAAECIVLQQHKRIREIEKNSEKRSSILFIPPPQLSNPPAVNSEKKIRGCAAKPSQKVPKNQVILDEVYHPAYALALNGRTQLNFAPFEHIRFCARRERAKNRMMVAARFALAACLIIAAGVGAAAGGIRIARSITEKKIAPVRAKMTQMNKVEASYDSLKQLLSRSAGFLGRESEVTRLLSDIQHAVPEGVWAQEITIAEKNENSWDVNIIAVSYSTATIPVLIGNMEKLKDTRNVKMQYSEQTKTGESLRKKNAVRLKLVCSWGDTLQLH